MKIPDFGRRAWNFAKALARHAVGGFRHRDEQEIARIAAICKECPMLKGRVCAHPDCGCPVTGEERFLGKLSMESEHCPVGKW